MLLEPLLGYKSSWRIFGLLAETPRKPVSRRDVLRLTRLGNAPLSRALDRLSKAGILILEKRGNKEFYYLNERNEYAQLLAELWKKEQKSLRNLPYHLQVILSEFLRSMHDACNAQKMILFGSHAKGTASLHSDIDLAIVSDSVKDGIKISRIVKKIEQMFTITIQVHFFLTESFSGKSSLLQEIKNEGIDLMG